PLPAHGDGARRCAALLELLEAELERRLRPVASDHLAIVGRLAECGLYGALRDAGRHGLLLEIREPGRKALGVVAAGCRRRGPGCQDQRYGEQQPCPPPASAAILRRT